ncbi:MAG: serine/threonine protein kinase [Limisphaerales bacterium]
MADTSNKSGQFPSINEDFKIVKRIGIGGMGAVYEAIQLKLDRTVAIKILADRLASDPEFLERFEREARSAALVNHPNLVQVYDFGESDGMHYSVMELIDGENLGERLKRTERPMDVPEALEVVSKVATALNAAWNKKRIIHRDIKPENVMITVDGQVKLADLGLAKILGEESNMTMTGMGLGSPHYMSPEQASDAKEVDFRSDIYSLGITLLSLLTGKKAFKGNSPYALIKAHAEQPLPTGADLGVPLPDSVEQLIQKMAAKRVDDRFQSYEELLKVMGELMTDTDATITIPPRSQPDGPASFSEAPTNFADATAISYAKAGGSTGVTETAIQAPKRNYALYAIVVVTFAAVAYLLFDTFSPPQQSQSAGPANSNPVPNPTTNVPNTVPPGSVIFGNQTKSPTAVAPDEATANFLFGNDTPERTQSPGFNGNSSGGPRPPPGFMMGLVRPRHDQWHYPIDLAYLGPPTDRPLTGTTYPVLKQQAAEFVTKNPQNFRDIFNIYEQVWFAADETGRIEVQSLVSKQIDLYQKALNSAIAKHSDRMKPLVEQQKIAESLDVWRQFPENLITFKATDQIWREVTNNLPAEETQKLISQRPLYQGHPGGRGRGPGSGRNF